MPAVEMATFKRGRGTNTNGGELPENSIDKGPPWWRSQRYILAYILFFCNANMYFQRMNLSISIICMVNHTALSLDHSPQENNQSYTGFDYEYGTLPGDSQLDSMNRSYYLILDHGVQNSTYFPRNSDLVTDDSFLHSDVGIQNRSFSHSGSREIHGNDFEPVSGTAARSNCDAQMTRREKAEDGPFLWDKELQGLLLGAMFWTYVAVQIPGNHLVRNVKKKTLVMISMTILTIMTVLTPITAMWSPWALFVLKLVQGCCIAFAYISQYGMWGKWAPPGERATLLSFAVTGQMFGTVLVFPVSALLCKYGFAGGWPSVFYVFGILGFIWIAVYFFFSAESPSVHPFITDSEKKYIVSSLSHNVITRTPKTPWVAILTSPAFWGIVCAHFSFLWGYLLVGNTIPQYMYEVLKFDIKSNGVFTMLPYLVLLITVPFCGRISDFVLTRKLLSVVWARRTCIIISHMVPAVCFTAMSFVDCAQSMVAVALLIVGVGATGFAMSGYLVNPYDIAPQFATTIMTMSNTVSSTSGFLTSYVVGAITKDQTREQWQYVFFLTAGIYTLGTLGFCVLSRGTVQSWAMDKKIDNSHDIVVIVDGEDEILNTEEKGTIISHEIDD